VRNTHPGPQSFHVESDRIPEKEAVFLAMLAS
jgi:hypothetical protein